MKICPKCETSYSRAEDEFCSNDGARLVLKLDYETDGMVGRTVADRFDIVGIIGGGGMGTVYKAIQTPIDRVVALKVLRPDLTDDRVAVGRFRREAKAASLLSNPHTITLYEAGEDEEGTLFLAMELLEGSSLSGWLFNRGAFDWRGALEIAGQIAESLAEAHEKGIVHRDLKPENIFLTALDSPSSETCTEPPCVKVLDFGIATLTRPERNVEIGLTRTGVIVGTPGYMSPEQAKGLRADARSDIYALGCLLYEMITRKPPFESEEAVLLMGQHISADVPPFEVRAPEVKVPEAVEYVIMKMLAKSPDERLQSAREALAVFAELTAGTYKVPAEARRSRLTLTNLVRRRRRFVLTAVVPAVIVGTIALGVAVGLRGTAIEASSITTTPDLTTAAEGRPDAEATDAEEEVLVVVEVEALPGEARISLDGRAIEKNPCRLERPRSDDEHQVTIEAEGYLPHKTSLRFNTGQKLRIALERAPVKRHQPTKRGVKRPPGPGKAPTKRPPEGGGKLPVDTSFPTFGKGR